MEKGKDIYATTYGFIVGVNIQEGLGRDESVEAGPMVRPRKREDWQETGPPYQSRAYPTLSNVGHKQQSHPTLAAVHVNSPRTHFVIST